MILAVVEALWTLDPQSQEQEPANIHIRPELPRPKAPGSQALHLKIVARAAQWLMKRRSSQASGPKIAKVGSPATPEQYENCPRLFRVSEITSKETRREIWCVVEP